MHILQRRYNILYNVFFFFISIVFGRHTFTVTTDFCRRAIARGLLELLFLRSTTSPKLYHGIFTMYNYGWRKHFGRGLIKIINIK